MYRHFRFKLDTDHEGTYGLLSLGSKGSKLAQAAKDSYDSTFIPHDILEHNFPQDNGESHFEWQAAGFAAFIRPKDIIRRAYFNNPVKVLANSYNTIHPYTMKNKITGIKVPPKYYSLDNLNDFNLNDALVFRNCLSDNIINIWNINGMDFYNVYGIDAHEYIRRAESWIYIGYEKARRKYHVHYGLTRKDTESIFFNIDNTAKKIISKYIWRVEEGGGFTLKNKGLVFSIGVDFKSCDVIWNEVR